MPCKHVSVPDFSGRRLQGHMLPERPDLRSRCQQQPSLLSCRVSFPSTSRSPSSALRPLPSYSAPRLATDILAHRAVCTGTAPATPLDAGPTAAVSYVPNPYFSFPYAPTTFANSASCASAVDACSSTYGVCVAGLQRNGGYAVTINVPGGGGTTVGGWQGDLGASATPVCSSLSSQACSRLEATKCESFGQGSGVGAARPRPRLSPMLVLVTGAIFFITFPDARL